MKTTTALALAAVVSCCGGSRFLEVPGSAPDTGDCGEVERTFSGTMPWTPTPFPFSGTRKVKMWTAVPPGWDEFDGELYMMDASWDVSWVSYMRMNIGNYPSLVIWDGTGWYVDGRVDVKPLLVRDGNHLLVEPYFTARGTKPSGKPSVAVRITFAVCGQGREGIR